MPTDIKPLDLNQFMEGLKKRNPGETEFHQAVEEVAACVIPYINDNPKYIENQILFYLHIHNILLPYYL